MSAPNLLQPLWSYLLEHWGSIISYWMFPAIVGWFVYVGVGCYFALKDIGPWRSEATRVHKDEWPTARDILYVGGVQAGIYTLMNVGVWLVDDHSVALPTEAPTVWEFVRDLTVSLVVGDFLVYLEHIVHHKVSFLYSNVHYVHHRFKTDLFAWCAGWVHPFETAVFAFCEILYPCILYPVHPLTLWVFEFVFISLLLEEHSGHDLWWSPYRWVPSVCGGAVPHSLHHTKVKVNFGFLFAVWDKMFGTFLDPAQHSAHCTEKKMD